MISAPEDYGLTPEQTLSHISLAEMPEGFDSFWREFRDEIGSLSPHWQGSLREPVCEIVIPSARYVRVVARVSIPAGEIRGIIITSHGYAAETAFSDDPEPWADFGLVTVRLRVRGYPPSTLDMKDVRADWILQGIESADAWILNGAVADIIQACRCGKMAFGPDLPVFLHGESFGGGLAVIAAAQLSEMEESPQRLILGLPTFGDWIWRSTHYCNGSGGQVTMLLDARRGKQRENLMSNLLLFDASLHARNVTCPLLSKLAHVDDTVPAPSAAAIHNAIASKRKWRFETKYGHFDGGISDLRRHILFEQIHPQFADPTREPEETMEVHTDQLKF